MASSASCAHEQGPYCPHTTSYHVLYAKK